MRNLGIIWLEHSISADKSLDAGMIWYGWRNSLENTACREISRMLSHLAISIARKYEFMLQVDHLII